MALRILFLCFVAYSLLSWYSVFSSWDHDLYTLKAGFHHVKDFLILKGEHPKMMIRPGRDGHPSIPTRTVQGMTRSIPDQPQRVR